MGTPGQSDIQFVLLALVLELLFFNFVVDFGSPWSTFLKKNHIITMILICNFKNNEAYNCFNIFS